MTSIQTGPMTVCTLFIVWVNCKQCFMLVSIQINNTYFIYFHTFSKQNCNYVRRAYVWWNHNWIVCSLYWWSLQNVVNSYWKSPFFIGFFWLQELQMRWSFLVARISNTMLVKLNHRERKLIFKVDSLSKRCSQFCL